MLTTCSIQSLGDGFVAENTILQMATWCINQLNSILNCTLHHVCYLLTSCAGGHTLCKVQFVLAILYIYMILYKLYGVSCLL